MNSNDVRNIKDGEKLIAHVIERNRTLWGVMMTVLGVAVLISGEPLWLLALIPFGYISYFLVMTLTSAWLQLELSANVSLSEQDQIEALAELNQRAAAGEDITSLHALRARAGVEDGQTTYVSEKVIGRYMDHDIYEFITIENKDGRHNYYFHEVTPKDRDGTFLIPRDNETYALLHGITYKRSST